MEKEDAETPLLESGLDSAEDEDESEEEKDLTTVCETFWNICNTIQGLPILSIPYTFKAGGWWSLAAIVIISSASLYTSQILVKSLYEVKNGVKVRVRNTYIEVGEAFWNFGGKFLVLVVMVTELVFVATMYPVLVGSILQKSFYSVHLPMWAWTMIGSLALFPNSLLKTLSQVAWTSIITVTCALVIFVSIIAYSFTSLHSWNINNMNVFDSVEFPGAVGVIVSCYLVQPFAPFIESTMKNPQKFSQTLTGAFVSMTAVNILVGLAASVTFYPNIEEVITNNLPHGIIRDLVNVMAAILAFTSYTLPIFASFDVIERGKLSCLPDGYGDNIYTIPVQSLRMALVWVTVLMSAFVPHFTALLSFVGSVTGITLVFIFPALFHMKLYYEHLKWWELTCDALTIFLGTACMLIGLIVSWKDMYILYNKVV